MRGALRDLEPLGRDGGVSIRRRSRLISAGIAALAIGFALGLRAMPAGVSGPETIQPKRIDPLVSFESVSFESRIPDSRGWRVASLDTEAAFESATGYRDRRASSAEELAIGWRAASFDERFAGVVDYPGSSQTTQPEERANHVLQPAPDLAAQAAAPRRAAGQSARGSVPLPALPPASVAKKRLRIAEATAPEDGSLPNADGKTAIYDIVAQTVYLPNGERLEAHSGLGGYLDDPRYVSEKDRGPTPPNVYDLSLREELFHGVRAVRLNPVGGGNMFGREGMLAHPYMLGANGQSNGCVSLSDYPAFLNAFLNGEINRLVVVEHLATTPSSRTAWGWIPQTIKALFGRS